MSQDLPRRRNRREIFKAHSPGRRILVTRWMETGSQTKNKELRLSLLTWDEGQSQEVLPLEPGVGITDQMGTKEDPLDVQ